MTAHTICLVGNPNCGKTTLFNALTGARQQVGNWPGVTVERKTGTYQGSRRGQGRRPARRLLARGDIGVVGRRADRP